MRTSLESFVETVTSASSKDMIWAATEKFVKNTGFQKCSLVTAHTANDQIVNPKTLTSFSREFKIAYENEGMGQIDPFLHFHCFDKSVKRIVSKDFSSFPKASAAHRLFLDHVVANGDTGGIGIPVRTRDHAVFGGWILSSSESDHQIGLLANEYTDLLQLIVILAYERMVPLSSDSSSTNILSDRERECLLWLCAGLRVSKIADKFHISDSAVNLYITNAKRKLGAKTQNRRWQKQFSAVKYNCEIRFRNS